MNETLREALEAALRANGWKPDSNVCGACFDHGWRHDLNDRCLDCSCQYFASMTDDELWTWQMDRLLAALASEPAPASGEDDIPPQPTPDEEREAVLAERLDWEAEQEKATATPPDRAAMFNAGRATGTLEGWSDYETLDSAYRIALRQIEADGETINRLTQALRVASHSPHDQAGEPDPESGFPVCSVCGAIQTASTATPPEPGLDASALPVNQSVIEAAIADISEEWAESAEWLARMIVENINEP